MGKRSDKKKRRKRELQRNTICTKKAIEEPIQIEKAKNNHENKRKAIVHKIYSIISKVAFPICCIGYIIIMSTGFLDNNLLRQYYMSLFMALLSLGIAIVFSDLFDKYYNKAASFIEKCLKGRLDNEIHKLLKLFISIVFAFVLWLIMVKKPKDLNIPIITKENIGNIMTWLSIIIFSIDKSS